MAACYEYLFAISKAHNLKMKLPVVQSAVEILERQIPCTVLIKTQFLKIGCANVFQHGTLIQP